MRAIALKIEIYDGAYQGDMRALTLSATLSGTVEGLAPTDFLREITVLLEMCEKRYATPTPLGSALTVFIRRKASKAPALLARIDVLLHDGFAKASLSCDGIARTDAEPVAVAVNEGDDVVNIARAVLDAVYDERQLSTLVKSRLKSVDHTVKPRGFVMGVPDDFPRDVTPASLAGSTMKLAGRLIDGKFVVGQTPEERFERWDLCEDLAQQLVPEALEDAAKYPHNSHDVTLQRVRDGLQRKGWVTVVEMDWLVERLRALLNW